MTHLPVTRDLQPLTTSANRRPSAVQIAWRRFVTATAANPDLIAVVTFCAIGVLVTINVILRFPDFGAIAEQIDRFP